MKLLLSSIGFLLGAVSMWVAYPVFWPAQTPAGYYDLSLMPDELAAKYADNSYILSMIKQDEVRTKFAAEREAKKAANGLKVLPANVPVFPFEMELISAHSDAHWPQLSNPEVQAKLDAAKDDWVVLNVWASWCGPCIRELPDMDQAAPRLQSHGVQLLTLNADVMGRDTEATVEEIFTERQVMQLPDLIVQGPDIDAALDAVAMKRSSVSLPHSLIFAPGGKPYAYFQGFPVTSDDAPIWNSDQMIAFFEALALSEPI